MPARIHDKIEKMGILLRRRQFMDKQRPTGRQKHVTTGGSGVHRRGDGLGSGPVGSSSGYSGRKPGSSSGGGMSRATKGAGLSLPVIIILVIVFMLRGGSGSSLTSDYGSSNTSSYGSQYSAYSEAQQNSGASASQSSQSTGASGWSLGSNTSSSVDTAVAEGARDKYTKILGGGKDTVTLMVYMCGTDLESRNGMATSDLQEMAAANIGDNVNLLVYTGGCAGWRNSVVSSKVNQIYQVTGGGLRRLESDMGTGAMTNPETLTRFIKWCKDNFPANRNELILWDHGGGSVSGYGYDEKYSRSGSMSLAGLNQALQGGGVKFDFIGFDTCLLATTENALMLNKYADYMVASEETEPGIGWYYTNWLTQLSRNTSMDTLDIGKNIIDDFVDQCARQCPGQAATLSITDLAELSHTVPAKLAEFSKSVTQLVKDKNYQQVSTARGNTREFARTNRIDQVDLIHLAENMKTDAGKALSSALQSAIKYNRTSRGMTNAYGLSIYFPSRRSSYVDSAVSTYESIGMDSSYSDCIKACASIQTAGQYVGSGGQSSSPIGSLFGDYAGQSSDMSTELMGQLLSSFLGGDYSSFNGLSGSNTGFLSGRVLSDEETIEYLSDHHLDASLLKWTQANDGSFVMDLPNEQWNMVNSLDMNMFYDDGEGYVDLGMDNIYSFDDDGRLVADTERNWLSINGQPVAYYHLDTTEDEGNVTITGRVPAILNGEEYVNLLIVFDQDHPYGYVAGAVTDYQDGETETVAKSMTALEDGDTLDFVCDFYDYEQNYVDSYMLGDQMTVSGDMEISNTDVGDGQVVITYCFTDMYDAQYWSEPLVID